MHDWMAKLNYKYKGNEEFENRVAEYQKYYKETSPWSRLLLRVEFTTLADYLRDLEVISRAIS